MRGVLEKYVKLKMYSVNLHVNVVGGLLLRDPAGDLAVIVAIASAYLDQPVVSSALPYKLSLCSLFSSQRFACKSSFMSVFALFHTGSRYAQLLISMNCKKP